jgi:hypothetical protein
VTATLVWVTALRKGVAYHVLDEQRQTPCGRWHGGRQELLRGVVITVEAAKAKAMPECARCYGHGEVVAPRASRGRRP